MQFFHVKDFYCFLMSTGKRTRCAVLTTGRRESFNFGDYCGNNSLRYSNIFTKGTFQGISFLQNMAASFGRFGPNSNPHYVTVEVPEPGTVFMPVRKKRPSSLELKQPHKQFIN
jgi:hypothetical protein